MLKFLISCCNLETFRWYFSWNYWIFLLKFLMKFKSSDIFDHNLKLMKFLIQIWNPCWNLENFLMEFLKKKFHLENSHFILKSNIKSQFPFLAFLFFFLNFFTHTFFSLTTCCHWCHLLDIFYDNMKTPSNNKSEHNEVIAWIKHSTAA